jgi:hypothetical protein
MPMPDHLQTGIEKVDSHYSKRVRLKSELRTGRTVKFTSEFGLPL